MVWAMSRLIPMPNQTTPTRNPQRDAALLQMWKAFCFTIRNCNSSRRHGCSPTRD